LPDEEEIRLRAKLALDELEQKILLQQKYGVTSGSLTPEGNKPPSEAELKEARRSLEATLDAGQDNPSLNYKPSNEAKGLSRYLTANPMSKWGMTAQDSVVTSRVNQLRNSYGGPPPQNGTVAPQMGTAAPLRLDVIERIRALGAETPTQPEIGQSSGEPEYKRQADATVQRLRVARGNPSDKLHGTAQKFFANERAQYDELLKDYQKRLGSNEPASIYYKAIDKKRK
jgi:hypothetical protein